LFILEALSVPVTLRDKVKDFKEWIR